MVRFHSHLIAKIGPILGCNDVVMLFFCERKCRASPNVLDCKNALKSEPEQLQNGDWVAHCDTRGVTNKLTGDDALPDQFAVSGMIINFKRD